MQLTCCTCGKLARQVEKLLGMLPADDVGEHEQMQVLQQLILENRQAGEGLGAPSLSALLL